MPSLDSHPIQAWTPAALRARWLGVSLFDRYMCAIVSASSPEEEPFESIVFAREIWEDTETLVFDNGSGGRMLMINSGLESICTGRTWQANMTLIDQSWPGVDETCPDELRPAMCEFLLGKSGIGASFCFRWEADSKRWTTEVESWPDGDDPDGSLDLLGDIIGDLETVRFWFRREYELTELDDAPLIELLSGRMPDRSTIEPALWPQVQEWARELDLTA